MTIHIFPGLATPKSQLYYDIQDFIAENGGRLRLADRLEAEMCHQSRFIVAHKKEPKTDRKNWAIWEDELIFAMNKSTIEISDLTGRSCMSVRGRYKYLRKTTCYIGLSIKRFRKLRKAYLKRKSLAVSDLDMG